MKVILYEDVRSLGKKGDIVEVSDGYGRNFIIPKKKGVEATPANLNTLKQQQLHDAKLAAQHLEAAQVLGASLEKKTVTLPVKVGAGCSSAPSPARTSRMRGKSSTTSNWIRRRSSWTSPSRRWANIR